MPCESCKNATNPVDSVPYLFHEAEMARAERTIKRFWILVLTLVVLLVGSNAAWLWYESQFQETETVIEAEQDGSGVNIVSGESVEYGAEGESHYS